ncbi:MAG: hypothetical protein WAV72_13130 [Bradyrhizobium sp.]
MKTLASCGVAAFEDSIVDDNSFSDLLYRFIAHYKWEPQHLLGSMKEFEGRARLQEVPLNFLLNAFLRFSSSATIASLLTECGFSDSELAARTLELKFPSETKFTQPDVLIESDKVRVFIEVKVDSKVKLEQVQKYALLHATMNIQKKKRPYLMFLTKYPFPEWWSPSKDRSSSADVRSFLGERLADAQGFDFLKRVPEEAIIKEYEEVRRSIKFGAHTWNSFGNHLKVLSADLVKNPDREVEVRVIDDFLSELRKRGFVD